MDRSAPQTVLTGVAITSFLCGTVGGLYGDFKHGAANKFLIYSVVNSGIVSATFFSIREYVVSPVLVSMLPTRQYQLRRQKLFHPSGSATLEEPEQLSWTDIRTSRLLDSGISGGLAGGILNAWKRGRRGITPGLATGALMCTLLQWCFNEFNIVRIHHVSANSPQHTPIDVATSSLIPVEPSTTTTIEPIVVENTTSLSPMDRILSMFSRRVSDEKYLERLKKERESHLRRIAELEEKEKPRL